MYTRSVHPFFGVGFAPLQPEHRECTQGSFLHHTGGKSRKTAVFMLKGAYWRLTTLLWACYCVDRLLDTHNPFGDKCADRGEWSL